MMSIDDIHRGERRAERVTQLGQGGAKPPAPPESYGAELRNGVRFHLYGVSA